MVRGRRFARTSSKDREVGGKTLCPTRRAAYRDTAATSQRQRDKTPSYTLDKHKCGLTGGGSSVRTARGRPSWRRAPPFFEATLVASGAAKEGLLGLHAVSSPEQVCDVIASYLHALHNGRPTSRIEGLRMPLFTEPWLAVACAASLGGFSQSIGG